MLMVRGQSKLRHVSYNQQNDLTMWDLTKLWELARGTAHGSVFNPEMLSILKF